MKLQKYQIQTVNSEIEYNYSTIKLTTSRINKGLLAIPVSVLEMFPKEKRKIKIYFDANEKYVEVNFTPYSSSSRECRIGGMKKWYDLHNVKANDEVVIQKLNKDEYSFRILTERHFLKMVKELQKKTDLSYNEDSFMENVSKLAKLTNESITNVYKNEFIRLSKISNLKRNYKKNRERFKKENTPYSVKRVLREIYKGKCQLTGFTFTQKSGEPYFEIHHINENLGDFIKNLLVVSPNIHAQFTYSNKEEFFDENGWLVKVKFNEKEYSVYQYIYEIRNASFCKEVHSENI